MAAGDPQIHKRNASDNGFVEVNGIPDVATAIGATASNTASRIVSRNADGSFTVSGVQLDTSATPTSAVGFLRWNDADKCAEIETLDGVVVQIGQESNIYARNESGSTLANGKAVVVDGASGQRMTFILADSTSADARKTIGLVTSDSGISNNGFGFVTTFGLVRELDTSAFADGDELFLSTSGNYITTKPVTESASVVRIGWVIRAHATQGSIFVAPHFHGTAVGDAVMNAASKAAARAAIDLGNVENTSDANKPVSTAQAAADVTAAVTVAADDAMALKGAAKILIPQSERVVGKRVNRWTHTEDITRATNVVASSVDAADFITLNGVKLQRWTPIPGQGLYAFLSSRISAAYGLLTTGKAYLVSAYVVNTKGPAFCGMASMGTAYGHEEKYIDSSLRRIWTYGVAIDANRMDYGRDPTVAYGSAPSAGDDQGVAFISGCDFYTEADCYIGGIQVEEIPVQKMSIAMIGDSTMRGGFGSDVSPYTENFGGDNYNAKQVSRYLELALNVPVLCRAVSGNTAAMMAARWATDITPLAHRSRFCVIQAGINDLGLGGSVATFQTNFTALRTLALADGMIPVMMTITPFGATGTVESNRLAANAWIRATFPFVIDAAEVVKDPFDASKIRRDTGWLNDGTHYGDEAKKALGYYAATLPFWDFPKPKAYEAVGTSYLPPNTYTVATLPTGSLGDEAYVTDATAPTYLGALTGGGSVFCKVIRNASAWVSA